MPARKPARKTTSKSTATKKKADGFTPEEREAMRDAMRERKRASSGGGESEEGEVLAKIAAMPEPDRGLGQRLHALIRASAPGLAPRLWYGMPAYSKDGKVLCFFQPAHKFKARYATLGFSDQAMLDDGEMWPTTFALTKLTAAEETRIGELLRKAVR